MVKILSNEFISRYSNANVRWGFGALSEITYARTYARNLPNGSKEKWFQCLERVVNGTFRLKHEHMMQNNLKIDLKRDVETAEEMYDRMFNFKILPPGRGLWVMGTTLTTHADHSKRVYAALNNCSFVSTENIDKELSKPFCFTMDCLMLGIGVGADVTGAGKIVIKAPSLLSSNVFTIEDSRDGWVKSLDVLLKSYFLSNQKTVIFNYDQIRQKGMPIKNFGGISSGFEPLKEFHEAVRDVLDKNVGKPITITTIADIINLIGKCVISGNVRRSAELLLGDDSDEFLTLKDWNNRPERSSFAWCSNNSITVTDESIGKMDFEKISENILLNGEPGFFHLDNARRYGRMVDGVNDVDYRVKGANPCVEQTLESYELCCLVETFISHHDSLEDYKKSLSIAFEYAKIVTLGQTHWSETNKVMLRNRRIGCSISGIAEFLQSHGRNEFKNWIDSAYVHIKEFDTQISEELCVRESIKKTSIKPSGTVSLLAGCSSGIHYSQGKYYIRRMRLAKNNELVPLLQQAGIPVEDSVTDDTCVVAEFPVESSTGENRFVRDVSMFEQLSLAALIQRYYADNSVSCTITFNKDIETKESIAAAIEYFLPQLKCLSMLPLLDSDQTVYAQMPLETITEARYLEMIAKVRELDLSDFYNGDDLFDEELLIRKSINLQRQQTCKPGNRYIMFNASDADDEYDNDDADADDDDDDDREVFLQIPESERYCTGDHCQIQVQQSASA
jgi:ribonucleoside-triphosphate reductase (thioredoxin)